MCKDTKQGNLTGTEISSLKEVSHSVINIFILLKFVWVLFRRLWKLHLHPSHWNTEERSGAAGQSGYFGSGLGSVPLLLVPHVWLTHWHSAHQAAAREWP